MAVLSAAQLIELRNSCETGRAGKGTKAQVNAATQAVEDYFENTARSGLGSAIETAAPGVFGANEKKAIVKAWLLQKFARE